MGGAMESFESEGLEEMTSLEPAGPAPRHKWGWIFVVLFFIELIAFGTMVHSWKAKIEQLRGYLNTKIAYMTQIEIDTRTKQLNDMYLGSGIFLAGTLVCAAIGFRRRQA